MTYLTVPEVVARLDGKVTAQHIYNLVSRGKLGGIHVGRKLLVLASSLDELLMPKELPSASPKPPKAKELKGFAKRHADRMERAYAKQTAAKA